jgi:hypothetical protein
MTQKELDVLVKMGVVARWKENLIKQR